MREKTESKDAGDLHRRLPRAQGFTKGTVDAPFTSREARLRTQQARQQKGGTGMDGTDWLGESRKASSGREGLYLKLGRTHVGSEFLQSWNWG